VEVSGTNAVLERTVRRMHSIWLYLCVRGITAIRILYGRSGAILSERQAVFVPQKLTRFHWAYESDYAGAEVVDSNLTVSTAQPGSYCTIAFRFPSCPIEARFTRRK